MLNWMFALVIALRTRRGAGPNRLQPPQSWLISSITFLVNESIYEGLAGSRNTLSFEADGCASFLCKEASSPTENKMTPCLESTKMCPRINYIGAFQVLVLMTLAAMSTVEHDSRSASPMISGTSISTMSMEKNKDLGCAVSPSVIGEQDILIMVNPVLWTEVAPKLKRFELGVRALAGEGTMTDFRYSSYCRRPPTEDVAPVSTHMPRNPEPSTIPFAHVGLRFSRNTSCISLSENAFSVDIISVTPSHEQARKIWLHSLTRAILPFRHQFRAATKSVSYLLLELWDKQILSGTWRSSDDRAFAF
jgi:hypothetical protein